MMIVPNCSISIAKIKNIYQIVDKSQLTVMYVAKNGGEGDCIIFNSSYLIDVGLLIATLLLLTNPHST